LLTTLSAQKIFVSSACGGGGTCGQCKVVVNDGGGDMLATEASHISKKEGREGVRLSCQLKVKNDMNIEVDPAVFHTKEYACTVVSNNNVATFIKELVLALPKGEKIDFRAGGFIQISCEEHKLSYTDFDIDEEYRPDWDKLNMWKIESVVTEETTRAYSMANYPTEDEVIMLNVRIATPPPRGPAGIPTGIMSSYMFKLKSGDPVVVSGPFGEFYAKETEKEMIFIGGGAGMAPMRSHLFDQLKRLGSKRKITFWYGGRSLREIFYIEDFDMLAKEFPNFSWHIALSEPLPEDNWTGLTGFIHQVLLDNYLKDHDEPEECEYYICGPPMMLSACRSLCDDLGVDSSNVLYDDFG